MSSFSTVLRAAALLPLLTLTSCAVSTSTEAEATGPVQADTASWCLSNEPADGAEPVDESEVRSLCVKMVAGSGFIEGSGLAAGSKLVVTSSQGDVLNFDVESPLFAAQLDGQMVSGDFDVTGTWANGEELQLVVDQA